MKNLLIILLVILMSGCHLTKKVTKSEATTTQTTQTNETASAKENLKVTNNLVTDQETITTVTEFYPPASTAIPVIANVVKQSDNIPKPDNTKGAVKSITVITQKAKTHDQGITEAAKEQQAAKTTTDNSSSNIKTDDIEKPAADPKRWRYIFGILVIIAGAVIYWKRATVLPWIKSVLSLSGKK